MPSSETKYDFLEPPKREAEIGRLGPYRVLDFLGRGGMGQVFHAVDSRLKRNVALKVMTSRFTNDKISRLRFLEEARSMAAIHHENVVLVFDVGEANKTPFMAMELLKGKSLLQRRQEGWMFSDEEIIELGKQVSRGLAAAHQCGIVHRDIKPGNIWIEEPSGRVKILDFGLAVVGEGTDRFSGKGSVVGSPGYLAPEQARDDPVDDRTDLYSLGVVLYELCVSRLPQVATTMPGQLLAILAHEPTPISELNSDVKTELADVIHCLLSKEPRDRPDSAEHLEAMLEYAAAAPSDPHSSADVADEAVAIEDEFEGVVAGNSPVAQVVVPQINDPDSPSGSGDTSGSGTGPAPIVTTSPTDRKSGKSKSRSTGQRSLSVAPTQAENPASGGEGADARKSKLPLVLAALSGVAALAIVAYLVGRPDVRSNTPLPENVVSKPRTVFQVLASTLKPFQLGAISVNAKKVKLGNALQFSVVVENEADSAATDPRRVNSKAKNIAALATFAKQGEKEVLVQHRKMRPRDMPGAGNEKPFAVSFLTTNLSPGLCDAVFRLQSPDGQTISEVSQQITITQ